MESKSKLESSLKVKPYPVDLPVRHYGELSTGYDEYLSRVKSDGAVPITLPHGEKVEVTCENIGRLAFLRDGDLSHFILALHTPEDETKGKWWPVGDVLKTSNKSRRGLLLMESVMERVVLFLLSQVIFGILERSLEEDLYFSAYSLWEHGKILWQNGEAVGFYTIKKKGSLCDSCTGQSYQLPVLDTVFVRSHWRRTGLALQMLEDFCSSQPSEAILGISFPMSPGMLGVCKKYLEIHEDERERLYEVEAPGGWAQRRNVWLNIQLQDFPKHCGNSEQSPQCSYSHERCEVDLEEEGMTMCTSCDNVNHQPVSKTHQARGRTSESD
ncbi:protein FAM169B isoform X2 [Sinocyclocheilus anshuiensis]|uniref:Protein FAM169B-like n=1 Tax=Sinocyclocheilus anshuiensis TaxID=1608454 RepID=A0A671MFY4_9TELE|nr:PREDICTED: protein FAM169B-like isoform X2 [Sinocyclocheilus anshuiensis]